jgi:hypothetical protein
MKFIFVALYLCMASIIYADNNSLPSTCKPIQMKETSTILSAKTPLLVMIHNRSKTDLWITHPVSEPSANAGWSSRLQTGNWSALALDKNNFELSCIESKPGHEQQVPCKEVIFLCSWSKETRSAKGKGTYWAGEDMILSKLIKHLSQRGFELPVSSQ